MQTKLEEAVQHLLNQGQMFLGYDLAEEGLRQFPRSSPLKQSAARALLGTGAVHEAQQLLDDLCARPDAVDEETLGLLARAAKERWRRSGAPADALTARNAYQRGYELSSSLWMGINAATLSWIVGEKTLALNFARRCLTASQKPDRADSGTDLYWRLATQGEALLLLGREEDALDCYRQASALAGRRYALTASSRRQIDLLALHDFPVPAALHVLLAPPSLVVFTGHMVDHPDRERPRFPASQEAAVRARITQQLERLDARIGCSSAACGADLLFIEAMQARGAEVHILLPYSREDFVQTSVAFAGGTWVKRFDDALTRAASVRYVTEESMGGDGSIFAVMGQMLRGYAALTALPLSAVPTLLAVWDGKINALAGGTADTIAHWPDKERCIIIPIDSSAPQPKTLASCSVTTAPAPLVQAREIKTLLFADVVGYSKLQEDRMPAFMFQFLQRIAGHLAPAPRFVNTWGDAIFALMDTASDLAAYALALQEIVCDTDWAEFGLPSRMSVRIGLHTGPVFAAIDPITGTLNYYGSHVNRAARLEAVTVPGLVYASEPFAALLTAEQQSLGAEYRYACDYIGSLTLHKKFGTQPTYHLRRV